MPTTRPGFEILSGELIGRDPRQMTPDQIHELGHTSSSLTAAVKAKCRDCCGHDRSEVRKCTAVGCPLWPFRLGGNPLSVRPRQTPEQREAASERLRQLNAARKA